MTLLPILVAVLLGALTLALVLYPLYRHIPVEVLEQAASSVTASTQAEREQTARAALKEVELDYQLGNLAETDYRSLRERYTRRAFVAMKSRRQSEEAIDALIEERLRQLREEHADAADKDDGVMDDNNDAIGEVDDAE